MAVGDIYVAKLFGTLLAQQTLNQFFYRQSAGADIDLSEDLFDAIDVNILADLIGCIHDDYDFDQLEVFNIAQPSMFWSATPSNSSGTRTWTGDERAPSFNVFSFKSNRKGAGTRSSYKRFSGLLDADFTGNNLTSTFLALTPLANLQAALDDVFTVLSSNDLTPCQVQAGWSPGINAILNFDITSWNVATFTSQVSRKP